MHTELIKMTVTLDCEVPGCTSQKTGDDLALALDLMKLHHAQAHSTESKQKPPKVERPKITRGMSGEEWATFVRKWEMFKRSTHIGTDELVTQLLACCQADLENSVYAKISDMNTATEKNVLDTIKSLAVLEVAQSVKITELMGLRQSHGEAVQGFLTRITAKANICDLSVKCVDCDKSISFADVLTKYVMLNGLADSEILRDILGTSKIDTMTLNETTALIEAKEKAARALRSDIGTAGAVNSVSAYKKLPAKTPIPADRMTCPGCNKSCPKFGRKRDGGIREFTSCLNCFRAKKSRATKPAPDTNASMSDQPLESGRVFEAIDQLAAIGMSTSLGCDMGLLGGRTENEPRGSDTASMTPNRTSPKEDISSEPALPPSPPPADFIGTVSSDGPVDNMIFDESKGWRVSDSKPHPRLTLNARLDHSAYHRLRRPAPTSNPADTVWVTDSGAQSAVAHEGLPIALGVDPKKLIPVSRSLCTSTHGPITLLGALFVTLSAKDSTGKSYTARVMVYISPDVSELYLSKHAQEQLKIIPPSYPQVGAAAAIQCPAPCGKNPTPRDAPEPAGVPSQDPLLNINPGLGAKQCDCPKRALPPGRPAALPFAPTSDNVPHMREWLVKRYGASTFNKCPHQPLPMMTGPPMKVNINESASPYITRRPPRVPIHWRGAVIEQIDRDIALGVIERVPPGTPDTWLHSMVITGKSDGSPRRTIDLQPLNKVATRETHHVIPPAQQVRSIPKNQLMSVFDAWNGYHSIPIDPADRDKFSFMTESHGKLRYCRAPQGYTASGDAYTHRYDRIVASVERLIKVVDDSLLFDDQSDREKHWWRVIDYLELCGRNGIVLNPEPAKFQFAADEVDFTAFHVSPTAITPLPRYIEGIKNFPTPTNITDIRAWFGLVNQMGHYGRLIDIMAPFKPLLSPKVKFSWSDELDAAFHKSKSAIVDAITDGVMIYDPARHTCLQTDYSGIGLGYWLRQKYCNCSSLLPDCTCPDGWKVVLAGSRYLRDAEKRYAAIEGECLGVMWALEDSRYFTLGCKNLRVATDHKPLLSILGNKRLDEIHNHRLFRMKQRTFPWTFSIHYVAGKANYASDTTSRYPAVQPYDDDMESDVIASVQAQAKASPGAISWAEIKQHSNSDDVIARLIPLIERGFPADRESVPPGVQPYIQYRERLSVVDGVAMLDDRMIIPQSLKKRVLQALHAAHQGISAMQSRAQQSVFWLGMTADITRTRDLCQSCAVNAPSQRHMPPVPPIVPEYPFQAIASDYFELAGTKFLVVVDRFSGWPHVLRAKFSHEAAGAKGLIRCLRQVFATFGVADELSSDGGPEFTAGEVDTFLDHWNVHHRISAAYNSESNGRGEVAVKTVKRLLQDNINADGSLDSDKVVSALLQYRNTPDPTTGMSPAMILFGRRLRDKVPIPPIPPGTSIFENADIDPVWHRVWRAREDALRIRFAKQMDSRAAGTHELGILRQKDNVRIQNLCGPHPKKWDRTGSVIEQLPYDQYLVRSHGSGRILRRNRRHLRLAVPFPTQHPICGDSPPTPGPSSYTGIVSPPISSSPDSGDSSAPPAAPTTPPYTPPAVMRSAGEERPISPAAADVSIPASPTGTTSLESASEEQVVSAPAADISSPAKSPPAESPSTVATMTRRQSARATAGQLPARYDDFVVNLKK